MNNFPRKAVEEIPLYPNSGDLGKFHLIQKYVKQELKADVTLERWTDIAALGN